MLSEILRFEWRYHTRQPSFIAAAALFFLIGFALTGTAFGPDNVAVTSPYLVMETLAFVSLFSVFAIAVFVSNAVIRDTEHRMEEIVFTTPVGRFNYLFGRFGGAFGAAVTTMVLAALGMIVATLMPWLETARVGPVDVTLYVWSLAVMVAPTLLFATALLFALATMTRSAVATYTASVFIYILYMVCAALTSSPLMAASAPGAGGGSLGALLDPFGMSSFFEMTRYWTTAEKNHRFVALAGSFLLNRAVWVAAAVATWGVAYRAFTFRLLGRKAKPSVILSRADGEGSQNAKAEHFEMLRSAQHDVGVHPSRLRSYLSATKVELTAAMRSLPFLLLLALWFGLAIAEIRSEAFSGEYGSASYPTTALITSTLQAPLWIIGVLIVIYYGAEMFWREQRFRMASLIDATPVSGAGMVLAKWSALVAMIGTAIVTAIAAGLVVQLTSGYAHLDPLLYLSLFYFVGVPLALYAAAAVMIHALSPGKYAGLVFVLLFVIATRRMSMLGLEHPLWRFAGGPSVGYSEMYGFSDSAGLFTRLMIHWSVLAAAFIAVAAVVWRRLRDRATDRLRALVRYVSGRGGLSAAVLAALLLITGGWIFHDVNVVNAYMTTNDRLDWKANYEKRYRALSASPQPRITAIRTSIELFPEQRRVRIEGDYTLRNDSGQLIHTLLVTSRRDARAAKLSVPAARISTDAKFGMHRFELDQPLPPGGNVTLHFDLLFDYRGTGEENAPVVENGSVVMGFLTFPSIGYHSTYEIEDPRERAKRHLGQSSTPDIDDPEAFGASSEGSGEQRVAFDAIVSTSADQIAITSGHLLREWSNAGRRYFHYRAEAPVRNRFAFLSGRYAIARRKAGDVDVSIAYHAAHGENVEAMLDAAVDTLKYCDKEFGHYPHRELKLVEVPSSWQFGGYAVPDTILFSESRTFLVDRRDPDRPDLVTRRVAHEVGHQWWGYMLVPATRGGSLTLVESLAKYTELMILERKHGRDHVRQQLAYELDRYLAGRSGGEQKERTLANVVNQPYIYYSKGALVLYAIRDLIGEAALNAALRRLVEEERGDATATTTDLLRHLRSVANDSQYALIETWMQRIVLYDFRLDSARVEAIAGGRFRVAATVTAAERESASDGSEKDVPLSDAVDVALFRKAPDDTPSDDLIVMSRTRLHSGLNELTFVVNEAPAFVAVDPYLLRIDRNRFDNVKRVDR